MTEENQGLDKYISQFARRFGRKREKGKRGEQGFTAEKAIEKFRLLSAAGADGQEPVATYPMGSTIILSDLAPGTIIREKYYKRERPPVYSAEEEKLIAGVQEIGIELREEASREEGPFYIWYCMGSLDTDKKALSTFKSTPVDEHGKNTSSVYVLYEPPTPEKGTTFVSWKMPTDKKDACEFKVGTDTSINDKGTFFRTRTPSSLDNTVQVDVIAFGTKEKAKVKVKERKGLKELVPQRARISI